MAARSPHTPEVAVGQRVAQVRGVLAERIVVSTTVDPFLSLRALSSYSNVSVRTLRGYLDLPAHEALPHYRLPGGGKIVVRRSAFDQWIEQFHTRGRPSLADALRSMGLADRP